MALPEKFVITIGRSFGSGGRDLGRTIAEKLGIEFYDSMLLVKAAERAGFNLAYTRENDEKPPHMLAGIIPFSMGYYPGGWFGHGSGGGGGDIYNAQCDFIHELAQNGPCVIVGRSADYILRDVPELVNIFVHAPEEHCLRRIMARGEADTVENARSLRDRKNKLRREFYNFYTDKEWGRADGYHLSVDSSAMPMDELADFVISFIRKRLER